MNKKEFRKKSSAAVLALILTGSGVLSNTEKVEAGLLPEASKMNQPSYTNEELSQLVIDCFGEDYNLFYGWTQAEIDRFNYLDKKLRGISIEGPYIAGNQLHEEIIEWSIYFSALNFFGFNSGLRPSNITIQIVDPTDQNVVGYTPGANGGISTTRNEKGEVCANVLISSRIADRLAAYPYTIGHEVSSTKFDTPTSILGQILRASTFITSEEYQLANRGENYQDVQIIGLDSGLSMGNEFNAVSYLQRGEFIYNPFHFTELYPDGKGNLVDMNFIDYYTGETFERDLANSIKTDEKWSIVNYVSSYGNFDFSNSENPYYKYMNVTTYHSDGTTSKNEKAFSSNAKTVDGRTINSFAEREAYLRWLLDEGKYAEFEKFMATDSTASEYTIETTTDYFDHAIIGMGNTDLMKYIMDNRDKYTYVPTNEKTTASSNDKVLVNKPNY